VVEDMTDGLNNWMDSKGYRTLSDFVGKAVPNFVDWEHLNLNYTVKARIDQSLCIQCGRCYIACEDTAHQAIRKEKDGQRYFEVIDEECVGCNLCVNVCPVDNCITLKTLPVGSIDARTREAVQGYGDWTTHPNNPMAKA
jgi:dihydropyrimidine dehydrogenase (NAD+) subunit PreA